MSQYQYCKHHPSQVVSNGLFDAPCGECEYEMEHASQEWERNPENPYRRHCGPSVWGEIDCDEISIYVTMPWHWATKGCLDTKDEIPF